MPPKKSGPTRPKAVKTPKPSDDDMVFRYDGEVLRLPSNEADIPVAARMALASATTFTYAGLLTMIGRGQGDDFMYPLFAFLAKRTAGEKCSLTQILQDFDPDLIDRDFDGEDDPPEASGAD